MQFAEMNRHTLEDLKQAMSGPSKAASCSIHSMPSRSASGCRRCLASSVRNFSIS